MTKAKEREAHAAKSRIACGKVERAAERHGLDVEVSGANKTADGEVRVAIRTRGDSIPVTDLTGFLREVGAAFSRFVWLGGPRFEASEPAESEMFR